MPLEAWLGIRFCTPWDTQSGLCVLHQSWLSSMCAAASRSAAVCTVTECDVIISYIFLYLISYYILYLIISDYLQGNWLHWLLSSVHLSFPSCMCVKNVSALWSIGQYSDWQLLGQLLVLHHECVVHCILGANQLVLCCRCMQCLYMTWLNTNWWSGTFPMVSWLAWCIVPPTLC